MGYTPLGPKIHELHKAQEVQDASHTIAIITSVVAVFAFIGGIGYYAFQNTLSTRLQERKENSLLYQDANEQDILGLTAAGGEELPELEIGLNKQQAAAQGGQQMTAQQQQQQKMMAMMQGKNKQQAAKVSPKPKKETSPTKTPTPTEVPDNVYVGDDGLFSFEHEKWTKEGGPTEGDTKIEKLKSKDGVYTLTIGVTNKKYDSIEKYLETDPRGREPKNGTEDVTMDGQTAKKAKTFIIEAGGTYKTTAVYVFSKDKDRIYSLELDSTQLDVNNTDNEPVLKKIYDSFKYIEKKD